MAGVMFHEGKIPSLARKELWPADAENILSRFRIPAKSRRWNSHRPPAVYFDGQQEKIGIAQKHNLW